MRRSAERPRDPGRRAVTLALAAALPWVARTTLAQAAASGQAAIQLGAGERVVVFGGMGRTGRLVVRRLALAGVAVSAAGRGSSGADPEASLLPAGATFVRADIRDPGEVRAALAGATRVVIAAAATIGGEGAPQIPEEVDFAGVRNVSEAARALGVRQIVLVSALSTTDPSRVAMPPLREALGWKKRGEDQLRGSGVPYTILRPGRLIDQAPAMRGLFLDQGDRVEAAVTAREDLATLIVAALGDPDALGKTCEVFNYETGWPTPWPVTFAQLRPDADATVPGAHAQAK